MGNAMVNDVRSSWCKYLEERVEVVDHAANNRLYMGGIPHDLMHRFDAATENIGSDDDGKVRRSHLGLGLVRKHLVEEFHHCF